jgi:hypothetical protein
MAYYRYRQFLQQQNDSEFDEVHHPGAKTPTSGIYRCESCGLSITAVHDQELPPQNHHQHSTLLPILWRLVVKSRFPW